MSKTVALNLTALSALGILLVLLFGNPIKKRVVVVTEGDTGSDTESETIATRARKPHILEREA